MADNQLLGQMRLNRMCDGCHGNAPQVYCECTGNRMYLCGTCISGHISKNPALRHELIPAETEVSNMITYRERSDALAKGKRELEENLMKIDQCCEDLTAAVEGIVRTLIEYLDYQLNQLRKMKVILSADIDRSVKEAENALAKDIVQLTEKYSQYLRRYEKDNLILFNYEISPNLAEMSLQHMPNFALMNPGQYRYNISVNTNLYRNQLVRLRSNQVEMFNFETETWGKPIQLFNTVQVNDWSIYTHVDANYVFCCGFDPARVTSMNHADYLIDFISGGVEELPPLSVARKSPGVLHYEGELFVFGCNSHAAYIEQKTDEGYDAKEVEMMQITERRWIRLPDMSTGRSSFTPCVHSGNVYLCNGYSKFIDILELRTRRFRNRLPIVFPNEQYSNSVNVIIGDELIIITTIYTTIVNFLLPAPKVSLKHREIMKGQISNPVKYGNRIYWVTRDGKCMRVTGNKWEIVELVGI